MNERTHLDRARRFEELLAGVQAVERLAEVVNPEWDPPEIREMETGIDGARLQCADRLEDQTVFAWDEAKVWKELYNLTYLDADKLRQIAQGLAAKFDAAIVAVDDHNTILDKWANEALRLQLDLNL